MRQRPSEPPQRGDLSHGASPPGRRGGVVSSGSSGGRAVTSRAVRGATCRSPSASDDGLRCCWSPRASGGPCARAPPGGRAKTTTSWAAQGSTRGHAFRPAGAPRPPLPRSLHRCHEASTAPSARPRSPRGPLPARAARGRAGAVRPPAASPGPPAGAGAGVARAPAIKGPSPPGARA